MPIFLSYIRLSDNTGTDVRYQGHESRKDNVMQPSQNKRSGQHEDEKHHNELP